MARRVSTGWPSCRGCRLEDVTRGLPGDAADEQARWIEATVMGMRRAVRLCGLYLPNGNPVELGNDGQPNRTGKYGYKLDWMSRMEARARDLLKLEEPVVMAGGYNIIPQDEDAARPEVWRGDALALPESRAAFRHCILHKAIPRAFSARARAGPLFLLGLSGGGLGKEQWDRYRPICCSAVALLLDFSYIVLLKNKTIEQVYT